MKWLDEVVCDHIQNFYEFNEFEDGKASGTADRKIKRNVEMQDPDGKCSQLFMDQFWNSLFARAILTRRTTGPMFVKYSSDEEDGGGYYDFHNDAPLMGKPGGWSLRTDYLMITAINDESEYEGGDLWIRVGSESYSYRLKKGEALFFDPNHWHSVRPVTKGERRVCVMWVETLIQNAFVRELLYDYQDLTHYAIQALDESKWEPDIKPDTYFNAIKYKLMREYASTFHNENQQQSYGLQSTTGDTK
jgi:PKHD-type hydroxylase|tara:strand:+ start:1039 stop:1779 length:741 start_codon:yes stop_codon:yes gene_type:complete